MPKIINISLLALLLVFIKLKPELLFNNDIALVELELKEKGFIQKTSIPQGLRNRSILYETQLSLKLKLWIQDEGVVVGTVGVDGVLGQGALAPGVDTAHAVDVEVDVEIDETAALDVLRMTGSGGKVLFAVVPGTDAEGLESVDAHSA